MSGAEILSLVGIIIGLAVLVVLVMKGINIYVVAFIASIIVAVFGRMNLYEALKTITWRHSHLSSRITG